MNLVQAIRKIRFYAADLSGENWSDNYVVEALMGTLIELKDKLRYANREWLTDTEELEDTDFTVVGDNYLWYLPERVEEVREVYLDPAFITKLPKCDQVGASALYHGWRMAADSRRALIMPSSYGTVYAVYSIAMPWLNTGVTSTIGAATITCTPTASMGFSTWVNAYRSWPIEITSGVALGQVLQCSASAVASATTFTVTPPAVPAGMVNTDTYAMRLPWDGRLNKAICVHAAYQILLAEGHRRQQQALEAEFQRALMDFETSPTQIGGGPTTVEEVC